MGSSQSIEVPGGGTEGYHVLRVSQKNYEKIENYRENIFGKSTIS